MRRTLFCIFSFVLICSCNRFGNIKSQSEKDNVMAVEALQDTPVISEAMLRSIPVDKSLKIKYIPRKIYFNKDTLLQQNRWLQEGKELLELGVYDGAAIALRCASGYKSGEACYLLGRMYRFGQGVRLNRITSDSLLYCSARYGYAPGIIWQNSEEGVFVPGDEGLTEAEFPGGDKGLIDYLQEEKRKAFADSRGMINFQGRVYVSAIIEKDGTVKYVKVLKNMTFQDIESDIEDMFKNMPEWKPATFKGQPVRCFFEYPVIIRLGD